MKKLKSEIQKFTKQFALVNLVLVCIWLILAVFIGRENKRLVGEFSEDSVQG